MMPSVNRQIFGLHAQFRRREFEKRVARDCCGIPDLDSADLDRQAAPGRALIGCQGRIALDDGHGFERHVEFVRCDLGQGRQHARAKIDLAGVDGDHAICIDGEESIDLIQPERLSGCGRSLRKRIQG